MPHKYFDTMEEAKAYANKNWYIDKTTFTESKLYGDRIKASFEEGKNE